MSLADLHQQCVKFIQMLRQVAAFFRAHDGWDVAKPFLASANELARRQRLFDRVADIVIRIISGTQSMTGENTPGVGIYYEYRMISRV